MNEGLLVRSIVRAIEAEHPHVWVLKTTGCARGVAGVPDLLVCADGRFAAIEVKHQRPGESHAHAVARTTAQQRWHIERILRAGGSAGTATSIAEALALLSP